MERACNDRQISWVYLRVWGKRLPSLMQYTIRSFSFFLPPHKNMLPLIPNPTTSLILMQRCRFLLCLLGHLALRQLFCLFFVAESFFRLLVLIF